MGLELNTEKGIFKWPTRNTKSKLHASLILDGQAKQRNCDIRPKEIGQLAYVTTFDRNLCDVQWTVDFN